jgi:hypothetical protein
MTGPVKPTSGQRPVKRQCTGHKRDGSRCRLSAIHGATVCHKHGGSAPQVKAAAARRVAEDAALAATEKYGIPIRTTAAQALRDELERTAGIVAWLTARVQALPESDLTWGQERRVIKNQSSAQPGQRGQPSMEVTLSGRPHTLVMLLQQERKHLASVAAEMARIGIETRLARATEAAGGQIVQILEAFAVALGRDPADLDVQTAGATALHLVSGDA